MTKKSHGGAGASARRAKPSATATRFSGRAATQRNAEILKATLHSFSEHGCFQANLDQVIASVGIAKGTLYRHYPSREDLFNAGLNAGLEDLRVRCRRVGEAHETDPQTGFRAVIDELVSLNRQQAPTSPAALARLICCCEWSSASTEDRSSLEAVFLPLVQHWQARHLFDQAVDPFAIAASITALVNSPALIASGGTPARDTRVGARPRDADQQPSSSVTDLITRLLCRAFAPDSRDGDGAVVRGR